MKRLLFLLTLLAVTGTLFAENLEPKADPAAVVTEGNARFTILTDRLIRMEWAEDGIFEDRASLAIVNRHLPVPKYKVTRSGGLLTIVTDKLTLTYKGGRFDADNLKVVFPMNKKPVTWHPGMEDKGNLKGTTRTLDGCLGFEKLSHREKELENGILSRDGWTIVDESARHLFEKVDADWENWIAERPEGDRIDWYIFAYGHDYTAALGDFIKVAGRIPLPPKYTLGYWWSRYWIYTDDEMLELGREMRERGIPMDVMIIDMDWHYTYKDLDKRAGHDDFNQRRGWTGYTWNRDLFPDPEGFLKEVHGMGYKTALNLHPASGIRPYEECYDAFLKDYLSRTDDYDGPKDYIFGDEPYLYKGTKKPVGKPGYKASVPFRIDQIEWADAYFNSVLHPLEKQGVDFWWLDWQQWLESRYVKGLSNTFWLNYVFFHDMVRQNARFGKDARRPLIYHRYQLGFSGDTYDEWSVLQFLPYFTATASNVGYGYWGHDIGGHMMKKELTRSTDPETYTRWLQYGVFTPIFKTHSTQNARLERKFWAYPSHYDYMLAAVRLRYTLSPYIYTAAHEAYETGVSMCRPLYYVYPEEEKAYTWNEEFFFGDRILATAVCHPAGADGKAERKMWFPKGNDWYDMALHQTHKGGTEKTLYYTIDQNPWYVKAGSVLPLAGKDIRNLQDPSDELGILIVPGNGTSIFDLYEDDGISQAYDTDYAVTRITKKAQSNHIVLTIGARKGSFKGMSPERKVYLVLEGVTKQPNGIRIGRNYLHNAVLEEGRVRIDLGTFPAGAETEVEIFI